MFAGLNILVKVSTATVNHPPCRLKWILPQVRNAAIVNAAPFSCLPICVGIRWWVRHNSIKISSCVVEDTFHYNFSISG
jgi:hypothetical protein